MKYRFIFIWVALAAVVWGSPGKAESVDLSADLTTAIGQDIHFFKEQESPLDLEQALKAYTAGKFLASNNPILNFGIGANPVWLRFETINPTDAALLRCISLETSWLDNINIYFLRDGQVLDSHQAGDTQAFAERPVNHRFFFFEHTFAPGTTTVMIRVETPDPMVLPVFITSAEKIQTRDSFNAYSYGFVYGVLIALLAYNFMLFLSLKNTRYLFYSIYLSSFVIANIAYTGHGFEWLWPEDSRWQQWSNPVLMIAYAITGLIFATQFLETRKHFPRLHRLVLGGSLGVGSLLVLAVIASEHAAALLLAFAFILVFSPAMVFLGAISVYAGVKFAKYFLIASIATVISAAITALAVWGYIPYNLWTFRAVEIGMLIDAILLAFALADQFRVNQEEKNLAERLANIDHLTGLNNRRAFYDFVTPVWLAGERKNQPMSVILLDIDHFKSINDTHGHALGDDVLIQTAKTITMATSRGDIAARWGGEEFILFLPETNLIKALSVAEKLREKISQLRLDDEGKQISFTASFGVAHRNIPDINLDELISIADTQLYLAKELGRDRVCSLIPD